MLQKPDIGSYGADTRISDRHHAHHHEPHREQHGYALPQYQIHFFSCRRHAGFYRAKVPWKSGDCRRTLEDSRSELTSLSRAPLLLRYGRFRESGADAVSEAAGAFIANSFRNGFPIRKHGRNRNRGPNERSYRQRTTRHLSRQRCEVPAEVRVNIGDAKASLLLIAVLCPLPAVLFEAVQSLLRSANQFGPVRMDEFEKEEPVRFRM